MAPGDDPTADLLRSLRDLVAEDADTLSRAEVRALRGISVRVETLEARIDGIKSKMDERRRALYGTEEAPGLFERVRAAERLVEALRDDVGTAPALREQSHETRDLIVKLGAGLAAVISTIILLARLGLLGG